MPGNRENDFKRNNVFSLHDLYGHTIATYMATSLLWESWNLLLWFTLPWSSLLYAQFALFLPGSRKSICKQIHQFYTYYPKIISPWDWEGGGHEIYNFSSSHPTWCYIPSLVKVGPVVLEKEMLMHDDENGGHQPIAIGYPSDSGDLKIV